MAEVSSRSSSRQDVSSNGVIGNELRGGGEDSPRLRPKPQGAVVKVSNRYWTSKIVSVNLTPPPSGHHIRGYGIKENRSSVIVADGNGIGIDILR